MKYKEIAVGQNTSHGVVQHIYSCTDDFIVFLTTDDDLKVLSERSDAVFKEATFRVRLLSSKAFKKLKKVHIDNVNDRICSCLGSALAIDVELDALDKIFEPAVQFIDSLERTKRVLARGPNPQHVVYITKSNQVEWQTKLPPPHAAKQLGKLDRLKQLSVALLPSVFRKSVAVSIGNAASSLITSAPTDNFDDVVKLAEANLTSRVKEFNLLVYSGSAFLIAVVFYGVILGSGQLSNFYLKFYLFGTLGGVLGALVSALQRASVNRFSLYDSRASIVAQAVIRILIGAISGFLLAIASQANIAFGLIQQTTWPIFVFGVAAGFAERWVPDLFSSLSKKED